jgi:putative hydrolase of the HAD superfamily
MKTDTRPLVKAIFIDIGGVLLSNGWGHASRELAAEVFHLDSIEMEKRHHFNKSALETGMMTLHEYLNQVVFYQPREFSLEEFRDFIFVQSTAHLDMIELIQRLKKQYQLKIVVVSNEGRELNAYRIKTFNLIEVADFFICSSYVHLRKPDPNIFRLALDVTQVPASQIVYIDDVMPFVEIANGLGIHGIHHTNYLSTSEALAETGLNIQS